jgi:DNA-binding MarR family transcriptional regulator
VRVAAFLTEKSKETIGYVVRQTNIAISRALQRRLALYNLTSPQMIFMREIWLEEGLSQRELSARVGTAESTTVSALRVLERRRLIKRIAKPGDRRAVRVYLTPAGRQLELDVVPKIRAANELFVHGIPAHELDVLNRVLTVIRRNASEIAGAEAAREESDPARAGATAT